MKTKILSFIIALLCVLHVSVANNISVTGTSLTGQVAASDYTNVQFNISWENSWRMATGVAPDNWDAAWVFVKYKVVGGGTCTVTGEWKHATLSSAVADYSVVTDNGVAATFKPAPDGVGVFIHRSGDGNGNINWQSVKLRWNYGANGLADDCQVTFKVMAVEMVYVPGGGYLLGDGSNTPTRFESGVSGAPFQVTTAMETQQWILGGGTSGSLGNNNGGSTYNEDFNDATAITFNNPDYPKGTKSFYCMKYETSNEQYLEFLNTLTATQQGVMYNPGGRGAIVSQIPSVNGNPRVYACNLDGDANFNEANDGQYIACNVGDGVRALAYLDWAGLRPMTELEYEKACRGNATPFANEYAWGGTAIAGSIGGITNSGASNEYVSNPSTSTNGNAIYNGTSTNPLRCGIFATGTTTRTTAGATYFGIMEMSGNLDENCVSIGNVAGRSYTANHGDGFLTSGGYANVNYWPGVKGATYNYNIGIPNSTFTVGGTGAIYVAGLGARGGSIITSFQYLTISQRVTINGYSGGNGCRGVRTE